MKTNIPVSTIMTKKLITVKTDDRLSRIEQIFKENVIHHIPVIDQAGLLKGMISKVDMLNFLHYLSEQTTGQTWSKFQIANLQAERVMTPNPISIDPDDSIGLAADIILSNQLHALPIVEGQELLGLVTSHDLLKCAFTEIGQPLQGVGLTQ